MKIVVVGPGAVGKTYSCRVLRDKKVPSSSLMTLGADFYVHSIEVGETEVSLQLWDLAGQDRFGTVRSMYYLGLNALMLMFDLSSESTLEGAKKYLHEEIKKCIEGQPVNCIAVVGNKRDLEEQRAISEEQLKQFVEEVKSATGLKTISFTTSAYEYESVEYAFKSLVRCALELGG